MALNKADIEQLLRILKRAPDEAARRFGKIKTKSGEIVPFVFNRMQRYFIKILLEDLESGRPIRWHVLKARQLGSTTFLTWIVFWVCWLYANRNALIAAHDKESVVEIFDKVKIYFQSLPPELRPLKKSSTRTELFFANPDDGSMELGLQSKIRVQTIKNANLGASATLQILLLTEIARYEQFIDPKIVMTAVNQTMGYLAGTMAFWETTAEGEGWHKSQWDDHEAIFKAAQDDSNLPWVWRPLFVSWLADEDYRTDITEYFVLQTQESDYYGDEIAEQKLIFEELHKWYFEVTAPAWFEHESMCRLAWRRWAIDNKCEKDKYVFMQQYPTSAEQAFRTSGTTVFNGQILYAHEQRIKRENWKPRYFNYMGHKEDVVDWWNYAFEPSGDIGPLRILELPNEGAQEDEAFGYLIPADPSYGIEDANHAAAIVFKYPEMKQVATWDYSYEPGAFGDVLYALGMWYNTALIIPESAQGPGVATLFRLWNQLAYPHLYYRETVNTIDFQWQQKYGWSTDPISKPVMMAETNRALTESNIVLTDLETCRQLKAYKKYPRKGDTKIDKFGAPKGDIDDLVSCVMIGVRAIQQTHIKIVLPKPKKKHGETLGQLMKRIDKEQRWSRFKEEFNRY